MFELKRAWNWREKRGLFEKTEAIRVFHGPGEALHALHKVAIDRFGDHYWVTQWESSTQYENFQETLEKIIEFYKEKKAASLVILRRPEKGALPTEPEVLYGEPPLERWVVKENGSQFWIEFLKGRHPGLFLDHQPLRDWLERSCDGLRVFNTFAYTGSLSVAARRGGAEHVTTLDLSKASIQWAKENMALNGFEGESNRWIAGDVFDWLPRLKREGAKFDCVILDPPSFSHGKKSNFSTQKDLVRLHGLAMDLLSDHGILITSINSANVSREKFQADVLAAAHSKKMTFTVEVQIDLPETFPTFLEDSSARYLKGWILRRMA